MVESGSDDSLTWWTACRDLMLRSFSQITERSSPQTWFTVPKLGAGFVANIN